MPRRLLKSFIIGPRRWKILWEAPPLEDKAVAECHFDIRTIQLDPAERGRQALDSTIHEAIHAIHDSPGMPRLSEAQVELEANAMSGLLWGIGYRAK